MDGLVPEEAMSELVPEDPPPSRKHVPPAKPWEATLTRLQAHPNQWFRIQTYEKKSGAASDRYRLTKGELKKKVPPGKYEFVASQAPDGKSSVLHARYLGPEEPSS